jgi:hypothetical protein
MRYAVTLRGRATETHRHGTVSTVFVEAETGDEAAAAAFKPYHIVSGVEPAPAPEAKKKARA